MTVPASSSAAAEPAQQLRVLHVYGSPKEMGRAHGLLLGDFAATFLNDKMPAFFEQQVESVLPAGLPDWLVKLFDESVASAAPEVFNIALEYVYGVQKSYLESSPSHVLDELAGMAEGLCESGAPIDRGSRGVGGACDVQKLTGRLIRFNLLPELIRMSCSIVGATGNSTPSGGLNQLRALDFGGGPFANYSLLTVYHPDAGNSFASVGFAGFSNLVTGISQFVGLSEKVHEVYDNGTGLQPGTYKVRSFGLRWELASARLVQSPPTHSRSRPCAVPQSVLTLLVARAILPGACRVHSHARNGAIHQLHCASA